jgi:hypothetical protein
LPKETAKKGITWIIGVGGNRSREKNNTIHNKKIPRVQLRSRRPSIDGVEVDNGFHICLIEKGLK